MKKMKTFDQMCLEKLTELGPSTRTEWALAMGYNSPNAFWNVIKNFLRDNLIVKNNKIRPIKYKINNLEVRK